VEGLHAVLRPSRSAHGPHLHLPRADEHVLRQVRPQGRVKTQQPLRRRAMWRRAVVIDNQLLTHS
jgi:hypothetical protein